MIGKWKVEMKDKEPYKLLSERVCEECDGEGKTMKMVCYGGMPYEKYYECEECGGEGTIIEIEEE